MDVLGNRGKCAQTCRLPYELIEENQNKLTSKLDKGYLLSTRDLCSLEYLPMLIDAGVTSFKIEGRMKTPEYVATVTRIYRKYIDLAESGKNYKIDEEDRKTLSIEVLPTTKIKVKAPENKNRQDIIKKVQNKAKWITMQKRYFADNYKKPDEKKYISGECFRYLGKQYRLKVIKSNTDSVKLKNGYLIVEYNLKTPEKLINNWSNL